MTETPTITREELEAKLDAGRHFTLVEALSERSFEDAHLPGALNLPPGRVRELAPRLLPDKSAEIVVYCSSRACRNSTLVTAQLLNLGYRNVKEYEGGKQDWLEAGLPLERGASVAEEVSS